MTTQGTHFEGGIGLKFPDNLHIGLEDDGLRLMKMTRQYETETLPVRKPSYSDY
jgi:hypothetical protein